LDQLPDSKFAWHRHPADVAGGVIHARLNVPFAVTGETPVPRGIGILPMLLAVSSTLG
jgi:hypothetical protein